MTLIISNACLVGLLDHILVGSSVVKILKITVSFICEMVLMASDVTDRVNI